MTERKDATTGLQTAQLAAASGLGRLLGVVAMYPRTHSRIADALEPALAACRQCRGGFTLHVTRQGLTSPDGDLPPGDMHVERLHGVLLALAVRSLGVAPDASADDLHALAATLQRHKAQATTSSRLGRVDLSGELPQSIHVTHRSFGTRLVSEHVASRWLPGAPERVLRHVEGYVPDNELGPAAPFVTGIVARVVERVERGGLGPSDPVAKARQLDAVLDLCAHAMKHAIERLLREGGHLGELGRLAQNVEQAVAVSHDRQSAEVMLDVLDLAAKEQAQRRELDDDYAVDCALSLDELRYLVDELGGDSRSFIDGAAERSEHLTILVQLSQRMPSSELAQLADKLREQCSGDCGPQAIEILARGIADFATAMDIDAVDRFVPMVLDAVRAARSDGPRDLLQQLCTGRLPPAALARIWPHVVNELVQLPPAAGAQAMTRLPALAEADLEPCTRRLLRLDLVRRALVSVRVLDVADPVLREALARLLDRPEADAIGRRILDELRQGQPRWPAFEAVHASIHYDEGARRMVQEALRAGPGAGQSTALRDASVRVLLAALKDLLPERRHEPWIPGALAALGECRDLDPEPVLAAVLRRRLLFWPQWPAPCRRAARAALMRRHGAADQDG